MGPAALSVDRCGGRQTKALGRNTDRQHTDRQGGKNLSKTAQRYMRTPERSETMNRSQACIIGRHQDGQSAPCVVAHIYPRREIRPEQRQRTLKRSGDVAAFLKDHHLDGLV